MLDSLFGRWHAFVGRAAGADSYPDVGGHVGLRTWSGMLGGLGGKGEAGEMRNMLFWLAIFAVLLLFAAITNPSEQSFRSHLTELSFRRHLVDMRHTDDDHAHPDESGLHLPSAAPHPAPVAASPSGGTDTPPIAPFRFANHVAITLRTPPLSYKSLLFLSLAITSPLSPPVFLADPPNVPTSTKGKHAQAGQSTCSRERYVLFFGFLGLWSLVGEVPRGLGWVCKLAVRGSQAVAEGGKDKGRKKSIAGGLADRAGVLDVRAVTSKEEILPAPSAKSTPGKQIRKSDSHSNLSVSDATLPLHVTSQLPLSFSPESRRSSAVHLLPPQSSATLDVPTSPESDQPTPPVIVSLKTELAAAQSVLAELTSQLQSHEESVSDAHAGLQRMLDEVRAKRKEDDAERGELKSRTKALEEQKRQAEGARREAEKRLKAVESVRDGLEAKISAARRELEESKAAIATSRRNVQDMEQDGVKRVEAAREALEARRHESERLEEEVEELEKASEEVGEKVKQAEERLKEALEKQEEARRVGPEEEMMMMAAAYEAAAQEGYLHSGGQASPGFHGGAGASGTGGGQWASQAAQYMAEAGMPYLDQSYTARHTHPHSSGTTHAHDKDTSADGAAKRLADITGFEDFGPGATAQKGTVTPPMSDTESDIYGPHDPGSPNGGISSSFSANLLPQGLFKSLVEGDATPVDTDTEEPAEDVGGGQGDELSTSLEEALRFEPSSHFHQLSPGTTGNEPNHHHHHHLDSGSESSEDAADPAREYMSNSHRHSAQWRSPLSLPPSTATHSDSSSRSRLIPPLGNSTTTPPLIPGLPGLPGSRRWFSGTSSAENVNSFTFLHPASASNDSLLAGGGGGSAYEANPFAPSASEKKVLGMMKWGAIGKRWTVPAPSGRDTNGADGALALPTMTSTDKTELDQGSPSDPRGSWFARHNHLHPAHHSPNTHQQQLQAADTSISSDLSGGEDVEGSGRKPFRFFSLRKGQASQGGGGGGSGREGSPAAGE